MNRLQDSLDAVVAAMKEKAPPAVRELMTRSTEELKASGIEGRALKKGSTVPDFTLPNQRGERRSLYGFLAEGPVVLNVYRGGWCVYCNLEMKALHDAQPELITRGARLVGLTPELPDHATATLARAELAIDVLSDAGNVVSEKLGLVFQVPEALRPVYQSFGIDLLATNGDRTFKLPVPATFIIDQDHTVFYAFVNADYTRRAEPSVIVAELDALRASRGGAAEASSPAPLPRDGVTTRQA